MTSYDGYTLYYSRNCPYCMKVLRFMNENGITMEKRDTSLPGVKRDLVRIGGKAQVPCLVIDGEAMYESDDIIEFLREKQTA